MSQPLVSVVTPFHNTADYLAECIESVLSQTYAHFEYILVDNCSTDRSAEIAERYERQDKRIRLIRRSQLLTQVQNYNRALHEISDASRYCKIVQADDFLFPQCLEQMVRVFEQSDSVGLVSSYWLKGEELRGSGFPHQTTVLLGKEMARLYLRTGLWVFGSPSAVMYRSSMISRNEAFYEESRLHEDTEKCLQILQRWDFGFVPQVLSFSRADNASISSEARPFDPNALDRYINIQRYAPLFLDSTEADTLKRKAKRDYYGVLAGAVLHARESAFWNYHAKGLRTVGQTIEWPYLIFRSIGETLWHVGNPARAIRKAFHHLKKNGERPAL